MSMLEGVLESIPDTEWDVSQFPNEGAQIPLGSGNLNQGPPPTPFTWSSNFGDETVVGNGLMNQLMFG